MLRCINNSKEPVLVWLPTVPTWVSVGFLLRQPEHGQPLASMKTTSIPRRLPGKTSCMLAFRSHRFAPGGGVYLADFGHHGSLPIELVDPTYNTSRLLSLLLLIMMLGGAVANVHAAALGRWDAIALAAAVLVTPAVLIALASPGVIRQSLIHILRARGLHDYDDRIEVLIDHYLMAGRAGRDPEEIRRRLVLAGLVGLGLWSSAMAFLGALHVLLPGWAASAFVAVLAILTVVPAYVWLALRADYPHYLWTEWFTKCLPRPFRSYFSCPSN